MHRIYKPSGKISILYFFSMIITLFLLIPIGFFHAIGFWYLSFTNHGIFATIITGLMVAVIGVFWCIRIGKVRNDTVAGISAIFIGAIYYLLSMFFYSMVFKNQGVLWNINSFKKEIWVLLKHPTQVLPILQEIVYTGADLNRRRLAIHVSGIGYIVTFLTIFLAWEIFLIVIYRKQSQVPFCEKTRKWAKKSCIPFQFIENGGDLSMRIIANDYDYIYQLRTFKTKKEDYSNFILYKTEDKFYLTVINKKLKNDNEVLFKYKSRLVFRYMEISGEMGRALQRKNLG